MRFNTSGSRGTGAGAVADTSTETISLGTAGFAAAMPALPASAAKDTANGNRNDRFFI
jgi:hypothetical protein